MTKKRLCIIMSVVAIVIILTVITMVSDEVFKHESVKDNYEPVAYNSYESSFRGVIRQVRPDQNTMYIRNSDYGLDSEYKFKNSLSVKDKYGKEITYSQIKIGDMYRIKYDQEDDVKVIKEMKLVSGIWEYSDIENVDYDGEKLNVGDEKLDIDNNTVVLSGSNLVYVDAINKYDLVDIKGYGSKVYCIVIKKKHASLRLANYKEYLGGMFELGLEKCQKVVPNMQIDCKEGKYDIIIKKGNRIAQRSVTAKAGKTVVVDISRSEVSKQANVAFNVTPKDASIYINGNLYSYDQLQSVVMPYGTYDVVVIKKGYKKYIAKVTIDKEVLVVVIELKKDESSQDTNTTTNDNSQDSSDTDSNKAKVKEKNDKNKKTNTDDDDKEEDDSSTEV